MLAVLCAYRRCVGRVLAVEPAGDVPLAALVFSSIFRCRALCFCCATLLRLFKS